MFDQPDTHTAPFTLTNAPLMTVDGLNLWYGQKQAVIDVSFDLHPREILAFIGPSGCGKSTVLKALNRMHDDTRDVRITGRIDMQGQNVMAAEVDPPSHRRRFGWVAQKPNPFVMSVYDNVAYPARIHGMARSRADLNVLVEDCLRKAMLWDEVKDDLHGKMGNELSGGQQQRLCVARALATKPEIFLMDEPTGSIDPVATARIEELMMSLRAHLSVIVITHSMMQARRIADRVAFFHLGKLLEIGPTEQIFGYPRNALLRDFVRGKFG